MKFCGSVLGSSYSPDPSFIALTRYPALQEGSGNQTKPNKSSCCWPHSKKDKGVCLLAGLTPRFSPSLRFVFLFFIWFQMRLSSLALIPNLTLFAYSKQSKTGGPGSGASLVTVSKD